MRHLLTIAQPYINYEEKLLVEDVQIIKELENPTNDQPKYNTLRVTEGEMH